MSLANIFTPRGKTQLWPAINLPKGGRLTSKQCTFHPKTIQDYQVPPPPPPIESYASIKRRTTQKQSAHLNVKQADLITKAGELRQEAERLEQSSPPLSLPLQFGTLVLEQGVETFSKKYLKEWDQRGRGEVEQIGWPFTLLMCFRPCANCFTRAFACLRAASSSRVSSATTCARST